jgi:hypothetical protein
MPPPYRLQSDDDMVQAMELDLVSKIQAAYATAGLSANIAGVFSIDDLERMRVGDLCNLVGVGVAYNGAVPTPPESHLNSAAPGGRTVKMIDFLFFVILVVPHGEQCTERYDATKLLTAIRRGVLGTTCSGDATNRTWSFVKEYPNVQESSGSVLYYSQIWKISIPESNRL